MVQKNGLVALGLSTLTAMEYDRVLDRRLIGLLRTALPVRIVAVHHVVRSKFLEVILPVLLWMMGSNFRSRYVRHTGLDVEVIEKLEKYGLPENKLPKEIGGSLNFDFQAWITTQRK